MHISDIPESSNYLSSIETVPLVNKFQIIFVFWDLCALNLFILIFFLKNGGGGWVDFCARLGPLSEITHKSKHEYCYLKKKESFYKKKNNKLFS